MPELFRLLQNNRKGNILIFRTHVRIRKDEGKKSIFLKRGGGGGGVGWKIRKMAEKHGDGAGRERGLY